MSQLWIVSEDQQRVLINSTQMVQRSKRLLIRTVRLLPSLLADRKAFTTRRQVGWCSLQTGEIGWYWVRLGGLRPARTSRYIRMHKSMSYERPMDLLTNWVRWLISIFLFLMILITMDVALFSSAILIPSYDDGMAQKHCEDYRLSC